MKAEIAKGATWMILLRLCDRTLGLVSTLILARLLVPADFGLIAMAMSFIALIELAGAFSFEIALIQHPDPSREHYDTVWTLNLAFALGCAGLTAALALVAARFYDEPRLSLVMFVLSVGWIVQGLENIGIVNFRRRMDFSREFAFMFGKRIVGFVVTLTLAYALRSYWALIVGQLSIRFTGLVLSYAMEPFRPRLSVARRRELFSFSGWMLVSNIMGFGLARLPHFLIGRWEGSAALGNYTIASEFARLPSTELSAPINRAVFPGLARLTKDRDGAFGKLFSEVMGITVALTFPASIGLALVARPLVDVVLGAQWGAAAQIMTVLAVSGAIEVIAANTGIAYLAMGKTHVGAALGSLKLVVLGIVAVLLVPRMGILGMALAELGASALTILVSCAMLMKILHYPASRLLSSLWRPFLASTAMGWALVAMVGPPWALPGTPGTPGLLLGAIAVGAVAYVSALLGLWWMAGRPTGAESALLGRLRAMVEKVRGAPKLLG